MLASAGPARAPAAPPNPARSSILLNALLSGVTLHAMWLAAPGDVWPVFALLWFAAVYNGVQCRRHMRFVDWLFGCRRLMSPHRFTSLNTANVGPGEVRGFGVFPFIFFILRFVVRVLTMRSRSVSIAAACASNVVVTAPYATVASPVYVGC
jgi:hypothetical protein